LASDKLPTDYIENSNLSICFLISLNRFYTKFLSLGKYCFTHKNSIYFNQIYWFLFLNIYEGMEQVIFMGRVNILKKSITLFHIKSTNFFIHIPKKWFSWNQSISKTHFTTYNIPIRNRKHSMKFIQS